MSLDSLIIHAVLWAGMTVTSANAQKPLLSQLSAPPSNEVPTHSGKTQGEDLHEAALDWYNHPNAEHLGEIDAALQKVLPLALRQSPWVIQVPTWQDAHQYQAYHEAGALLLAKGCTLLNEGRVEEALPVLKTVDKNLPYSLLLRPDQTFLPVRKTLSQHEQACHLRIAILTQKVATFEFPAENDEFDAESQTQAVEDLTLDLLKKRNYDALDHFVSQARLRQLTTASSRWVSDISVQSLHPDKHESDEAWLEIGQHIREWRQKLPTSIDAQIVELHYEMGAVTRDNPKTKKAFLAKFAPIQKKIEDLGPVSPLLPQLQMIFSFSMNEDFSVAAEYFHAGYEKFPDYASLVMLMHLNLLKQDNGRSLGSQFLTHIAKTDHPQTVALALAALPPLIVPVCTEGLDAPLLEASIQKAIAMHPRSLSLRNDLGRLAAMLKMPSLAHEILKPVGTHWDRQKWMGMEEQAARLTDPAWSEHQPNGK